MVPPDDPFNAMETEIDIHIKSEEKSNGPKIIHSNEGYIKKQVFESMKHLLTEAEIDTYYYENYGDDRWQFLSMVLQARGIFWDAERQEYATKIPPKK